MADRIKPIVNESDKVSWTAMNFIAGASASTI